MAVNWHTELPTIYSVAKIRPQDLKLALRKQFNYNSVFVGYLAKKMLSPQQKKITTKV